MLKKEMTITEIKIGTRGSPLALVQAEMVAASLLKNNPNIKIEIIKIHTSGEWKSDQGENRLSEKHGGKGLFAKEIETAILSGVIDCGVHSLKDMDSNLPNGLSVDHVLPRADARDAFLCLSCSSFMDLPDGAIIGTSSLRRQAALLSKRPDLKIVPLRGNVGTRIEKLQKGQVDATLLAMAGLERLNIDEDFIHSIAEEEILPACGQGIIAVETRNDDTLIRSVLDSIHDLETGLCAAAERAVLRTLDGSCHTPIGAYAVLEEQEMHLRSFVSSPDGKNIFYEETKSVINDVFEAISLGQDIGHRLKKSLPEELVA